MVWWRAWLILMAFAGLTLVQSGCAGRQSHERPIEQPASMERPARPISEEQDWADRVGEVAVVILVVGLFVAGILIPIFLL